MLDCAVSLSVVQQDAGSWFCRLSLLGFQRGNGGETMCLWCLNLGPEIRTPGKNRFYLFHPRQPSWKLRGTSFSAVLSLLSITSLLREWNSFDWKQGSIPRWGQRFLSSFSLSIRLPLASHARRCMSILFYLLSIRSQLWFVCLHRVDKFEGQSPSPTCQ